MVLRPGELVDITIRAAIVTDTGLGRFEVSYPDGDDVHHVQLAAAAALEIVRVTPAEWPPRYGDMWRDADGDLWTMGRDISGIDGRILPRFLCLDQSMRGSWEAPAVLAQRGPMTLVHRELVHHDCVPVDTTADEDGDPE